MPSSLYVHAWYGQRKNFPAPPHVSVTSLVPNADYLDGLQKVTDQWLELLRPLIEHEQQNQKMEATEEEKMASKEAMICFANTDPQNIFCEA